MAQTLIHTLVEGCRAGQLAACVAKLPSGWVIMGERQVLSGYCLLLPDPVVPDLNALERGARSRFLLDMSEVGDALLEVTGALRINYAIYGNVEPALHAHIFPRSALEPEATRTAQPWALDWGAAPQYSDAVHGALKSGLKDALKRRIQRD
jgi:diadenosine tetraphosphate (Ap4A) HIT family hydrolase